MFLKNTLLLHKTLFIMEYGMYGFWVMNFRWTLGRAGSFFHASSLLSIFIKCIMAYNQLCVFWHWHRSIEYNIFHSNRSQLAKIKVSPHTPSFILYVWNPTLLNLSCGGSIKLIAILSARSMLLASYELTLMVCIRGEKWWQVTITNNQILG